MCCLRAENCIHFIEKLQNNGCKTCKLLTQHNNCLKSVQFVNKQAYIKTIFEQLYDANRNTKFEMCNIFFCIYFSRNTLINLK